MRKKWISMVVLFALAAVLGLPGCGGGGGSATTAPSPSGSIEGKAK